MDLENPVLDLLRLVHALFQVETVELEISDFDHAIVDLEQLVL